MKYQEHVVSQMLRNATRKERISHAYLFEGEKGTPKKEVAMNFIKSLICPNSFDGVPCDTCSICKRIEHNSYPDVIWIEPDGTTIKKEQIQMLQHNFNLTALENSRKVYVINDVDLLTTQAANSLLKFLEEPFEDVHAILLTDQVYKVLKTIRSRCQILSFPPLKLEEKSKLFDAGNDTLAKISILIKKEDEKIRKSIDENEIRDYLDAIFKLLSGLTRFKTSLIVDSKELWHNVFNDKDSVLIGIEIMLLIFHDLMYYTYHNQFELFTDYPNEMKSLIQSFDEDYRTRAVEVLVKARGMVFSNMNRDLFFDRLVIDLEGGIK
jgi:DNA polymerase-3 subunit delta'